MNVFVEDGGVCDSVADETGAGLRGPDKVLWNTGCCGKNFS